MRTVIWMMLAGCGTIDVQFPCEATWYADADDDGYGDPASELAACLRPEGYVAEGDDCDDGDPEVGATRWYPDEDGDGYGIAVSDRAVASCDNPGPGYASNAGDCDDLNPYRNPGEAEVCGDRIDNDCLGGVDDGGAVDATLWYYDNDRDGVGGETSLSACERPAGYVAEGGDCDDSDLDRTPGADELCDDVDNDCDDAVDEDAVDLRTFYVDADGDGHGDGATAYEACDGRTGDVQDGDDCDDTDPDAFTERSWYVDADGDGFGGDDSVLVSCGAPSEDAVLRGGDCADDAVDIGPGVAEVCGDGVDNDCDDDDSVCVTGSLTEADAVRAFTGVEESQRAGTTLGVGDLTGDGVVDLVITAEESNLNTTEPGVAWVIAGPLSADGALDTVAAVTLDCGSCDLRSFFGERSAVGDFNGDGQVDLAVTAHDDRYDDGDRGTAFLFYGPLGADLDAYDADVLLTGIQGDGAVGPAVAGDVDDDGVAELVFAVVDASAGNAIHVVDGTAASGSVSDAAVTLSGAAGVAEAGAGLAAGMDLDGDGVGDLAVGAPDAGSSGKVYVFSGPIDASGALGQADAILTGAVTGDDLGVRVSAQPDHDGDGYADLLIGASGALSRAGTVYLVPGPIRSGDVSAASPAQITGARSSDCLGEVIADAGDMNGDGDPDVALGLSASINYRTGAAYVFFGPLSGALRAGDADQTVSPSGTDGLGAAMSLAGDLDDDGYSELLLSAVLDDGAATEAGAVFVLAGAGQ
ncbi:MAG: FG-GAP repeat protein [Alphaproteobacteria bacterium]|nr:FG-GAP repeat protein [Alphaproteobacteria bacterium]